MRAKGFVWLAVAASLVCTGTVHADNPAEFSSSLRGIVLGTMEPDAQKGLFNLSVPTRAEDGVAGKPGRSVESICADRGTIWGLDAPAPVTCMARTSETEDRSLYRVKAGAEIGQATIMLFSSRPMRSVAPMESDEPRPAAVDAALPGNLRGVRHSVVFTLPGRTLYAVSPPITTYLEPPQWTPAAIVEWKDGDARFLGKADAMPSRVIENEDTQGALAWVPDGCGRLDGVALVHLGPGLPVVATFHTGVECEGDGGSPEAVAGAIRCDRAGPGIEAILCSRDELVDLDRQVARQYSSLRGNHEGAARDAIVASQKAWIRQRNACADSAIARRYPGGEAGCLDAMMEERLRSQP
jgi:uncharacterized protein YecT (DUF1311 family)